MPFQTLQPDFQDETFTDLEYSNENISHKEFEDCTFESCDFSDSTFEQCEFHGCIFKNCNLSLAKLNGSKFQNVHFVESKLVGLDFTKAHWRGLNLGSPFKFKNCLLNSSSFFGLKQGEMQLIDCRVHDVDFRDCNLEGASFRGSDLSASLFHHTQLRKANFSQAVNFDINVKHNTIEGATFSKFEALQLLESLDILLVD
jgi:fluoroquinolone resistance protein